MKKKKLRIAIFHLAFLYSGGGERLVLEEAIGLRKLGHKVDVFSPIIDTRHCFPELLKVVKVKRLFPRLPSWIPDVELISILLSSIFTPFLFSRFKNYDVYLGANQPGPWIAYLLSKLNNIPYAVYISQPTRLIHPRYIDQKTGLKIVDGISVLNIFNFFFKPLISIADVKSITGTPLVYSDGTYMKGILEEVYNITTVNTPGATNTHPKITSFKKRFMGSITIGKRHIPKPYLLVTNRHFPQKKFEYAIDTLRLLAPIPISLVICGKETSYTQLLKKNYAKENIYFLGLVNENNLEKLYRNAAVYLYPSPEEDFGLGIIEAMSYSVPTVAWNNAGPTGIITHGKDGLLAKAFDIVDFADNVRNILQDKKLYRRLALQGFQTVKKSFSFKTHTKTIERYLLQLLGKNY